ncbi:MAG: chorismate-binding protein [Maribacter arcticus]|uniref:chorismate-binding protein n=1 Tax=Maribacter arcticus TaxID=561365 RepID=UPI003001974B
MVQELFDRASANLNNELPFVLYRKPNEAVLNGVFQKDNQIYSVVDFSETGFVFAPFDLGSQPILLKTDEIIKAPIENKGISLSIVDEIYLLNESEKADYLKLITKALKVINERELDKVVLSRKIVINDEVSPINLFQNVLDIYPQAFCYIWHHPKVGTWIGATPEILLKSRGTYFTTMSLAGTQSSNEFSKPKWSEKELNEQQVVTDYILEALKNEVVSLKVSEVTSIEAGQLWHLRTEINGVFAPNKFGDVLRALHPTPAVCGTPIINAKKFIDENENYDRSFYTGFLGELNFSTELARNKNRRNQENSAYRSLVKNSELFVNLRCMQIRKDSISIYVGGGITSDSRPESEWNETVLKSNTMFRVLNHK